MHYRIDVTHLHISLQMSRVSLVDCQPDPSASSSACNVGWVSVGFATSPGLMTGATAVIGTPGGTDGIKLYELTASRAAVELPTASQTLEAAMMHADDEEFVMSFQIPRTDHAAAGRRLSVFVSPTAPTHLIFAHGHLNGASGLASHGYNSKASLTVALNHATFEPPMNPYRLAKPVRGRGFRDRRSMTPQHMRSRSLQPLRHQDREHQQEVE